MTIRFVVPENELITQAQVEQIYAQMLLRSSTFAKRIGDINTAHNGQGQDVTIYVGRADAIGAPQERNANTSYDEEGTKNVIFIPVESLRAHYNTETGPPVTLERIIAHELGGHVWQDVKDVVHDPNSDFSYKGNNILRHDFDASGNVIDEDDCEIGTANSAVEVANQIMLEAYGEIAQVVYKTIWRPGEDFITVYDENGFQYNINSNIERYIVKPVHDIYVSVAQWIQNATDDTSPLVLDLDGDGIELTQLNSDDGVYWDIDQDGLQESVGWVSADDGLLAIDLDGNGVIDRQSELFGNQQNSPNGFAMLATYDTNSDGIISPEDVSWSKLLVWQDYNNDGQSGPSELHSLGSLGITEISLSWNNSSLFVAGNEIKQISEFKIEGDITPNVIGDVWFKVDQMNSYSPGNNVIIDVDTNGLPVLRGYGDLYNLTISMTNDNIGTGNLLDKVEAFNELSFADLFSVDGESLNAVRQILFRWANVENVTPGSRGEYVDAQELAFLEKLSGQPFLQRGLYSNPYTDAGDDLSKAFDISLNGFFARLAVQGAGKELFTGDLTYSIATDAIEGITGLNIAKLNLLETEALGMASTTDRQAFWTDVVRVIEYTIGVDNLDNTNRTALNNAIHDSDTNLSLVGIEALLVSEPVVNASTGTSGADTLSGTSGNDNINSGLGDDIITTYAGNDTLIGWYGDDTLNGGTGGDFMQGGGDDDTYVYASGDGIDVIQDIDGDADSIQFGTGIASGDITFAHSGRYDLIITIGGSNPGQILIIDQFESGNGIETLGFVGSDSITLADINFTLQGNATNETLYGVIYGGNINDTIHGGGGHDEIYGYEGNNTLNGDDGDDYIKAGSGNDTITGGNGNDSIYAGNGNNILTGGAGDDYVEGGTGTDKYYFTAGNDTFRDSGGADDIIYLPVGFTSAATVYYKIGNDLKIVLDATNSITVDDHFYSSSKVIETLSFSGGPSINLSTVTYIQQGDEGNNTLNGSTGVDVLYGMGGDDILNGNDGNDRLYGGAGNDTLNGQNNDDFLDGGSGNDTVSGGSGSDTYHFISGHDTYQESSTGTDIVELASGWTSGDITFRRDVGSPLALKIMVGANNSITLLDQFQYATSKNFEWLRFGDGVTPDINLLTHQYTTYGTDNSETINKIGVNASPNDIIYGLGGVDTINGDDGDDILYGGEGGDILNGQDGADTLYGENGNDTLTGQNGNDILDGGAGNDTMNGGNDNDTYIVDSTGDVVTEAAGGGTDLIYSSVSFVLPTYVENLTLTGTGNINGTGNALSNTIIGNSGNNIIQGGALNDNLQGQGGIDTLSYSSSTGSVTVDLGTGTVSGSAGADTISSFENLIGSAYDDTLTGGNGNNTIEGGAGNDTLNGGASTDTVSYEHATSGVTVDLTIVSQQQNTIGAGWDTLSNFENVIGSAYNDTITGNSTANVIEGGFGNDVLIGGSSTDTASYASASAGVTVSLDIQGQGASYQQNTGVTGTDTLDQFENLLGSAYSDTLTGSSGNNTITGGDGDDTLEGKGGTDTLNGGNGIDTATYLTATSAVTVNLSVTIGQSTGGAGSDTLAGIENLTGSGYNDTLTGDDGANVLNGGSGNDTLAGAGGNDTLIGGLGTDTASYAAAQYGVVVNLGLTTQQQTVGAGADTLTEIENLTGSAYNDTLTGSSGNNVINGGDGNDVAEGDAGNDTLVGGLGVDTVSYQNAASAITFNLTTTTSQATGGAGSDTVSGFENLKGSAYGDTLTGDGNNNTILGLAGNDTIDGGAGNDIIEGGADNDTLIGGSGTDWLSYASAASTIVVNLGTLTSQNTLGAGSDTISGFENVTGSAYNDTIIGNGSNNTIEGGAGNDTLDGGASTDTISYEHATSGVTVDLTIVSQQQNTVGAGWDTLSNFENVIGSAYNDTITGNSTANVIEGGLGDDFIAGGSSTDTASYWSATSGVTASLALQGQEQTTGVTGKDYLTLFEGLLGSAFDDTLTGDTGINTLQGGAGNDILDGGSGNDTALYDLATSGVTVSLAVSGAQNTGGAGTDTLISIERLTGSTFDDVLTGNSSVNILKGGLGNDTLTSGAGADTLTGDGGSDNFVFQINGLGTSDTISDFSTSQSDHINVSDLLIGYTSGTSAISDFVSFATSGSNSILSIDRDGSGSSYSMQSVATLTGVTGLTADNLLASGHLVAA